MSKKKVSNDGERFKDSLIKVSKEVDKLPQDVTKVDYANSTVKGTMVEWELRKLGGFNALKNMYFPPEHNIVVQSGSKLLRSHRNRIENTYGKEIFFKEEFLAVFKEVMENNPIKLHSPTKPIKKTNDTKISRAIVAHFSDTHFGCNIDKGELAGINEFNWTIAARRTAFFMDQVVTYKPQYRDNTELFLLINGDIIAGVIHDQEWAVDLLTTQFAGTLSIFGQAITYAAQHYKKVTVVCTPGNHGRAMHKTNKGRASVHKWDSYENMIFIALKNMLASYKNVGFVIPESPYAIFDIQGHKFLQTHGDTVINVGNPGKNIDMRSINDQINKVNSQLLTGEENFAAIIVGHVHVPTIQLTDSGTTLLINGTLSGVDAFAQSIGILSSHPTQTLFEVVPGHAVGDTRIIHLKNADNKTELDKIIKPFEGKF